MVRDGWQRCGKEVDGERELRHAQREFYIPSVVIVSENVWSNAHPASLPKVRATYHPAEARSAKRGGRLSGAQVAGAASTAD